MMSALELNGHSTYFHWGVVQISLANLIVIAAMLAIFVLALVLPFPHSGTKERAAEPTRGRDDRAQS